MLEGQIQHALPECQIIGVGAKPVVRTEDQLTANSCCVGGLVLFLHLHQIPSGDLLDDGHGLFMQSRIREVHGDIEPLIYKRRQRESIPQAEDVYAPDSLRHKERSCQIAPYTLAGVAQTHKENKAFSTIVRDDGVGQGLPIPLNQHGIPACCILEEEVTGRARLLSHVVHIHHPREKVLRTVRIQLEVMEVQYTILQTDHVSSKVIRLHFDERFCHNCCRHTADLLGTAVNAQFFT